MKYYMTVENDYKTLCDMEEFESKYGYRDMVDKILACSDAAKEFYYNHGGYKEYWPLTFEIFDEDKIFIRKYKIFSRTVPIFNAEEI